MLAQRLHHLGRLARPSARALWLAGLITLLALALLLHSLEVIALPWFVAQPAATLPGEHAGGVPSGQQGGEPAGEPGGIPGRVPGGAPLDVPVGVPSATPIPPPSVPPRGNTVHDPLPPPGLLPVHGGMPHGERADDWDPPPPPPPEPPPPQSRRPVAYLTFDDGPSLNTPRVLDILKQYDIKATFFVCGNVSSEGMALYRRILAEGHAIGNHTFTHNFRTIYSSAEVFWEDFIRMHDLIVRATGYTPNIMRFPGGSKNGIASRALMDELFAGLPALGYQYFDWNIDSGDALKLHQEVDVIIQRSLYGAHNKRTAVLLMHDSMTRTATVEALPIVIEGLLEMGFTFQTLHANSPAIRYPRTW